MCVWCVERGGGGGGGNGIKLGESLEKEPLGC